MGGVGLILANSIVKPPSPLPARGSDIFVAAAPLRATKGPPQLVMSTAYSFYLSWDLQHFMVLSTSLVLPSQVLVFDFQPQDPESVYAALAALSGRKIPGVLQTRTMNKLPNMRCWRVGSCNVDVADATHRFNSDWDTDLIVGQHDCRHYTNVSFGRVGGVPHWREECVGSSEKKPKECIPHWYEFSVSTIDDMKTMGRKAYIL